MKKFLLGLLLLAGVAHAYTDAEKQHMLNKMNATTLRTGLGDLVLGGSGSVYVKKAGDTMTGALVQSSTTDSSSITTGSIRTAGGVGIGKSVFAGGNITSTGAAFDATSDSFFRLNRTGYTTGVNYFPIFNSAGSAAMSLGITGSSNPASFASTAWLSSVTNQPFIATPSQGLLVGVGTGANASFRFASTGLTITPGVLSLPNGSRAVTVTLSGTSTFITNTTVTANTKAVLTGVGASNVAPWLIGVSSGAGYSVGATGAGSAHAILIEGQ